MLVCGQCKAYIGLAKLTVSLAKLCQLGCKATVRAKSDPSVLTVGWMNEGETVANTLLAFWMPLLTVYRLVATTSVHAASDLVWEDRCLQRLFGL